MMLNIKRSFTIVALLIAFVGTQQIGNLVNPDFANPTLQCNAENNTICPD